MGNGYINKMSHVTFYRKYRSNTFSELIGQDHIVQTLQNAITHDRLSHAYIFSGPRGTGKTSTARILAKALNCETGATATPCLTCGRCRKISAGYAVDVIEIDAASNTGVDNIRDLNEQVHFVPVECRYKVYIIDEVHMLSTGAFNALLKTLEEPPKQTVFILATTVPQKIPATIHSRCQRLSFRLLRPEDVVGQLKFVAEKEGLTLSEGALRAIARHAGGCMRDALSLLDQAYSFKGKEIVQSDVEMLLGSASFDGLLSLAKAFINRDTKTTMDTLKTMIEDGVSVGQLCAEITALFQQLLYTHQGIGNVMDVDADRSAALKDLAAQTTFDALLEALEMLSQLEMDLRWFPNPETLLQVKFLVMLRKTAPEATPPESPKIATPTVQQVPETLSPLSRGDVRRTEGLDRPSVPSTQPTGDVPTPNPKPQPIETPPPIKSSANPQENWQKVLAHVQSQSPALYAILFESTVTRGTDNVLKVGLKETYKFFIEKLAEPKNNDFLKDAVKTAFNQALSLNFAKAHPPAADAGTSPLSRGDVRRTEGLKPPSTQPTEDVQKNRGVRSLTLITDEPNRRII